MKVEEEEILTQEFLDEICMTKEELDKELEIMAKGYFNKLVY